MTTLADRLHSIMLKKNISQSQLARAIGIKQPSIFKILSGQTLNPKNILEIAAALDVDPTWLKTGKGTFLSTDVIEAVSSIECTETFAKTFQKKDAKNIKLINVKDDSMSSTLESDDLIFSDMSDLSTRLQSLLLEKGLSQSWLAQKVNVSQQAIQKILTGQTRNPKYILEIAKALDVDAQWLKTGEGDIPETINQPLPSTNQFKIDLLNISAAANHSGIANPEYPEVINSISFSAQGLFDVVGRKTADGIYMITVPTDSMAPTINKGDIVFIDTKETCYKNEGIYIFDLNGHTYIKRLQRLPTGIIQAISDNKHYLPFDITEELFDTAVIRGKFISVLPINPKEL